MKTLKQRAEFYAQLLKELDKAMFSLNYGNTLDTHTHITITRYIIREVRDRDKKARKGVTS